MPNRKTKTDLRGRVVLLTGASQGIGAVAADILGRAGATVVGHYRSQTELADATEALANVPDNQRFLVAGNGGTWARHTGSVVSDRPITSVEAVSLESVGDSLDSSNPNRIDFQLTTTSWHDGFNFQVPQGAQVTLQITSTTPTALRVGPTREQFATPFQFIA